MPTELLSFGPVYALLTNVVYALPAAKATLYSDAVAPALQTSNVSSFAVNTAITLTNGQAVVGGRFIRTTAGPTNISLARD